MGAREIALGVIGLILATSQVQLSSAGTHDVDLVSLGAPFSIDLSMSGEEDLKPITNLQPGPATTKDAISGASGPGCSRSGSSEQSLGRWTTPPAQITMDLRLSAVFHLWIRYLNDCPSHDQNRFRLVLDSAGVPLLEINISDVSIVHDSYTEITAGVSKLQTVGIQPGWRIGAELFWEDIYDVRIAWEGTDPTGGERVMNSGVQIMANAIQTQNASFDDDRLLLVFRTGFDFGPGTICFELENQGLGEIDKGNTSWILKDLPSRATLEGHFGYCNNLDGTFEITVESPPTPWHVRWGGFLMVGVPMILAIGLYLIFGRMDDALEME